MKIGSWRGHGLVKRWMPWCQRQRHKKLRHSRCTCEVSMFFCVFFWKAKRKKSQTSYLVASYGVMKSYKTLFLLLLLVFVSFFSVAAPFSEKLTLKKREDIGPKRLEGRSWGPIVSNDFKCKMTMARVKGVPTWMTRYGISVSRCNEYWSLKWL